MRGDGDGRGVRVRLIDDEVADDARLRVEDRVVQQLLFVGRALIRVAEHGCQQARKELIGGAELVLVWRRHQVVVGAINGAQAARELRVADLIRPGAEELAAGGMSLRHENLFVDETQISRGEDEAVPDRRDLRLRQQRRLWREERNPCRRHNQGERRDDGTVPGPRPP